MSNQLVISSGAKVRNLSGVLTGTSGVVNSLGINVPDGIPQLDGSGKILVSQLPNSVMEYKGSWNAATNTPTLANGTGNAGDVYLCEVAGTVNFGAGPIEFFVGDQVVYSGSIWQRASGATGTVSSVAVTESGDALTITGSPITTSGTINIGFAGTSGQYVNGAGGLTTFPSLTGYVPYTGATGNVDLGTYGLLGDYIGFNTAPTSVPTTLGTLSWDSFYRTLQLIDGDGDTTLQIGQEQRALIHNNTGATLTDGQVVYVTGSTGELPSVALASNATEASSSVTFGVVTESIANGADGFVTISGMVNGLNTLAYNEGDALYLGSTAGTFTNVKPTAPANLVLIGYMIKKSGGNGSVFVKIQNGYELEELHDVSITSVANNEGIFWDSATSLWKNKTIAGALGYTPANDSLVVHLAGTETITGGKFFTGFASFSGGVTNNSDVINNANNVFSHSATFSAYSGATTMVGVANGLKYGLPSGSTTQFTFASGVGLNYTFPSSSGTLALTSDLSGYLPLSGGTLTGKLTINTGGIDNQLQLNGTAPSLRLTNAVTGATINGFIAMAGTIGDYILTSAVGDMCIGNQNSGKIMFGFGSGTATAKMTIDSSGNGIFSGTLSATGGTLTGALSGTSATFTNTSGETLVLSKGSGPSIQFNKSNATAQNWAIATDPNFNIYNYTLGGTPFSINAATNAATFSSSVTATDNVFVNGSGNTNMFFQQSGTTKWIAGYVTSISAFRFSNGASDVMTLTNGGNVGIGTSSPSSIGSGYTTLDIEGSNGAGVKFGNGSPKGYIYADGGGYNMGTDSAIPYIFYTSGSERMRITSGGKGLFGTSTATAASSGLGANSFQVKDEVMSMGSLAGLFWENRSGGVTTNSNWYGWYTSGGTIFLFNGSANIASISSSTGVYTPLSDINKKKDFEESTIGLNAILGLKPTLYRMKNDEKNAEKQLGFIAQEVKDVIPQAFVESGDFIGLNFNAITAGNTKAIQELYQLVLAQNAKINELKALIAAK